jgi:hypothetical protein
MTQSPGYQLPRTKYDPSLMPGLFMISADHSLAYLRMPKNASTSISNCLAQAGWSEIRHQLLHRYPVQTVFTVIREPVSRFFSAFCNCVEDPVKRTVLLSQIRNRGGRSITELDFHFCPQRQVIRHLRLDPAQISFFRYNQHVVPQILNWLNIPTPDPVPELNPSSNRAAEFDPPYQKYIATIYQSDTRFYQKTLCIND